MIEIIKLENGLPISVIVPLQEKRKIFFHRFALPLIIANNPSEIIINDNDGNAAKKRNEGFTASSCPFVFPCDDDILLPKGYLGALHDSIKDDSEAGYAYTGYSAIVMHTATHPMKSNYHIPTKDFDGNALKGGNYISSMSLMKREIYPSFDETLPQFDDHEMYLRLLAAGVVGKGCRTTEFMAFFMDEGITSVNNSFSLGSRHRGRNRRIRR